MLEKVIVILNTVRVFDFLRDNETEEEFQAMEKSKLISGEPEEIAADKFNEMLDVLPPLRWCTIDGVEMFCMSEMYTGTYTNQYAHDKSSGKYYTKMVDACDKSTWINNYLRK